MQGNKGKLMMLYDDLGQVQNPVNQEQSENYVVYCVKGFNNYLYVPNKMPYTYLQTEAKLFTKQDAENIAKSMSKSGVNKWKA